MLNNLFVKEIISVVLTVAGLLGIPGLIFDNTPWQDAEQTPVIHLTGIMDQGIWTSERVHGLNYWWKTFKPAKLLLRKGEKVLLRLTSADVTHSFYMPELHPEPIVVKSGFTEELLLIPDTAGIFQYYCTTVCGDCHYSMQGQIVIGKEKSLFPENLDHRQNSQLCQHDHRGVDKFNNNKTRSLVETGREIFNKKRCFTCHGKEGTGGVYNYNYVSTTVPALNTIAERMKIYWEEDAEIAIKLIEKGFDLVSLEDDPPIDNFTRFLAQHNSYREKIKNGSLIVQKKDSARPEPPLVMPAWDYILSDREIDALLAYMISLYPWEEWED